MRAIRRIGMLAVVAWCLGGGATASAEDRTGKPETKVNINEASKADLMKLEGVGAGTAQKIIAYREAHGPFKRVQDAQKVEGVGKAVLEKNAGRLTVK